MFKRQSITDYDSIPVGYYHDAMLNGPSMQRFWHRKKFEKVASLVPNCSKVLDIGCGPGSFSYILNQISHSSSVLGIDIAESQIDYAKEFIMPTLKNGEFLRYEGEQIPFKDNSFDCITLIEVIEHLTVKNSRKLINEAMRLLVPKGKLIITTPNYKSHWPILEMLLEKFSPVKYGEQHISRFTSKALTRVVEASNFQLVKMGSLFIISPYVSFFSFGIANKLIDLENKVAPSAGCLLIGVFEK